MRAIWKGTVLAESDDTVVVEGNHYFPTAALRHDLVRPSDTHTVCPWKGTASYFSVEVDGQVIYEIDALGMKRVINGVDQLVDQRRALGL